MLAVLCALHSVSSTMSEANLSLMSLVKDTLVGLAA